MIYDDGNFRIRELHLSTRLFQVTKFKIRQYLYQLLGLWCCFIISTNTDLFWDLNLYDSRVQTMACCSFGYFIYDSFSMIKHNGLIQSYDILLHHLIVFGKLIILLKFLRVVLDAYYLSGKNRQHSELPLNMCF